MKAIWNDTVIAESNDTIVVEGNHYFPLNSIKHEFFTESAHNTSCGWKGLANYFSIEVNGKVNANGAWIYKNPTEAAERIKGYVAFWQGVIVTA
jgi:uncharacterized protein (DUF427 family)